jgi:hypothetical protein
MAHLQYDGAGDTEPDETPTPLAIRQPTSSSFSTSSQRIVRNGQVVVTNSDSDSDYDSQSSMESPGALLARFQVKPSQVDPEFEAPPPEAMHLFTLDDLVNDALDDEEAQNVINKIKQEREQSRLEEERRRAGNGANSSRTLRDDVLATVGDGNDANAVQRLKDAVDRTEAFDQAKSWSFFKDTVHPPSPLRFPLRRLPPDFWGDLFRGRFPSRVLLRSFSHTH